MPQRTHTNSYKHILGQITMPNDIQDRCERARQELIHAGLEAMLVTHPANRFYISGFELHNPQPNESAGTIILMADGKHWLCTDARYLDAAKRLWPHERIHIYSMHAAQSIAQILRSHTKGPIGFEANSMSVAFHTALGFDLHLQAADTLINRCRAIKDDAEIAAMRKACALNHELMAYVPTILEEGRSEIDIAWDIEAFFRTHGASELAFQSIVAFNTNAALPHAIPNKNSLLTKQSHVLIDTGCRYNNYCSDQTRTFWFGDKPEKRFIETLELVKEAQARALELIKPGVLGRELYQVAKDFFAVHGVAEHFTHGLGHGIGLDTHEGISLHNRCETPLQAGMIITIEPGLYEATWGGVRWEYMVLITEDGYEIL